MLKTNPNSNFHDEPHTLRSGLPSDGIPICKSPHLSSLSLGSNPLEISQSPTRGFVTPEDKSQSKVSVKLPRSPIASCQKNSFNDAPPGLLDTSDLSQTANQTPSASNIFAETKKEEEMKTLVSKGESDAEDQEHKRPPPTEDVSVPCPPGNVFTASSSQPSIASPSHEQNNPYRNRVSDIAASPSPQCLAPFPPAPLSEMLSSVKFFSFVILHVPEDQEEAGRVCGVLNNLKIGEGTTFCEGFETAGVSPLTCLEDAVENSAYIVLLLTTGFSSRWGEFQTNAVLMNSIQDKDRSSTVLPFISKFKTVGRLPFTLRSLVPLDERSSRFGKVVQNTFKQDMVKRLQERWQREQDLRAWERKLEAAKDLSDILRRQQGISMDISSLLSSLPPQIMPGCGSVIQINNASYVQIGDQNCMTVQQPTDVPHTQMSAECSQECDKELQN